MDNKTVVFDAQKEIAELKRRVEYLEKLDPNYGKAIAYASGLSNIPFDGYTAKLHDSSHNLPFQGEGNWKQLETDPELLEALKLVAKDFKENKLD